MLQKNSVYLCLLFSTLCLCFGQESNPILADYEQEIQVIANAANADQMHELLIDRDKRIMKALEILAKSTTKKEKAPGITIDHKMIQIHVSGSQNRSFLNVLSSVDPIIFHLSDNLREPTILNLKKLGIPQRDLEKILEIIPKDFDTNQWQIQEVTRLIGESEQFGHLLNNTLEKIKNLDDRELKGFLELQRDSNETASRNLFVQIMAPLSTHGRLVLLKFGSRLKSNVNLSRQVDEDISQQDLNEYRASLSR